MQTSPTLPGHQLREIAVSASVHPRTLSRALRGERISPMPLSRIRAALRRRGLEHLLAPSDPARPNE